MTTQTKPLTDARLALIRAAAETRQWRDDAEPVDWRARYLALREAAIVYAFGDEARAEDIAGTPCGAPDGDACETCALLRALGVAPGGDDR